MKRYRVEFSPEAVRHVERIQNWWSAHRPAAADLFRRELTVAIRQLVRAPHSSPAYAAATSASIRRLLLSRTRHHVYFVTDDDARVVRVYAVWHSSRGAGPVGPHT